MNEIVAQKEFHSMKILQTRFQSQQIAACIDICSSFDKV